MEEIMFENRSSHIKTYDRGSRKRKLLYWAYYFGTITGLIAIAIWVTSYFPEPSPDSIGWGGLVALLMIAAACFLIWGYIVLYRKKWTLRRYYLPGKDYCLIAFSDYDSPILIKLDENRSWYEIKEFDSRYPQRGEDGNLETIGRIYVLYYCGGTKISLKIPVNARDMIVKLLFETPNSPENVLACYFKTHRMLGLKSDGAVEIVKKITNGVLHSQRTKFQFHPDTDKGKDMSRSLESALNPKLQEYGITLLSTSITSSEAEYEVLDNEEDDCKLFADLDD